MLSRTHLLFGFIVLLISILFFNIELTSTMLIITIFASLLPDIDEKSSKIGRKFKFISLIFDHRGLLHTIWFALLFSIIIHETLGTTESYIFFIIYSSHLLLDGITKKGIKLFNPLQLKLSGNIKVGSFKEKLFFYLLLVLTICIFVYYFIID